MEDSPVFSRECLLRECPVTTEIKDAQRTSEHYTAEFFERLRAASNRSADAVVPVILDLLPVRSVVDVGCGEGAWLAAFRKFGVEDIFGVDGDYVDRSALQIPESCFRAADLSAPLSVGRTFELAVSLEVAEHLPPESAAGFVGSLTRLAPAVLFSAAIPFQGGTHHVNEQWPDSWARLFHNHGYVLIDCIRKYVWQNEAVLCCYAQNLLLFVRPDVLRDNPRLQKELSLTNANQLRLVHPTLYLNRHIQLQEALRREAELRAHPASGIKEAVRILWQCVKQSFRVRVISRWRGGKPAEFEDRRSGVVNAAQNGPHEDGTCTEWPDTRS